MCEINGVKARAQMESEFTVVTVPLSFVEYRMNFSETLLEEWRDNGAIVKALLHALHPWNVQLSNVSSKLSPANLGEVQNHLRSCSSKSGLQSVLGNRDTGRSEFRLGRRFLSPESDRSSPSSIGGTI